jgi:ATP-binding cassette subfamily C protein
MITLVDSARMIASLALPYGPSRLFWVLSVTLVQSTLQVLGVASLLPFLILATDAERLRATALGSWTLAQLPVMSDEHLLVLCGVTAAVLVLLANLAKLFSELVRHCYAYGFCHWLQKRLVAKLTARPYAFHLRVNSGLLIKQVADDTLTLTRAGLLPLLDSAADLLTSLLLLAALFLIEPGMTLVSIACLGVFYLLAFSAMSPLRHAVSTGVNQANKRAILDLQQLFRGIKTIYAQAKVAFFRQRYEDSSARQARYLRLMSLAADSPRNLVEPVLLAVVIAAIVLGVRDGRDLTEMLPALGAMGFAAYRLIPGLNRLYTNLTRVGTTHDALREVHEILQPSALLPAGESPQGAQESAVDLADWREVCFDHVSFSYPGAQEPALADISLQIGRNQFVGLVGPSGGGKSTLLDLLMGLHEPQQGRILVDDRPLETGLLSVWRTLVAYVPQTIFLLDDTVRANIAFGIPDCDIDEALLRQAAKKAQILVFIESELPQGFSTVIAENGVRLSGGQSQRIGLARALYARPTLLVLDESTNALDCETEAAFLDTIDQLRGELTVIQVSHRDSALVNLDRVYRVADGLATEERDCVDCK